jgi:hypothetical protein
MSSRRVFFSFNYEQDIWRAANVRKAGTFDVIARAGWADASIWEKAKRKGEAEIRRMIDTALKGSSVTAVLIGADTADRYWVNYEIEKSIERGNGLLGVRIHTIKDQNGKRSRRGAVPQSLGDGGYPVYDWSASSLGRWAEHAAIDAGKPCLKHARKGCFMCTWMWWW